ncbi:MAG: tetratricopeptide repeat protein [Pseudomonadales bacterium]|nr:tetratricopeptide repeat protein [Pseudomonadales bacterium]NRA16768.1 tetratricopeptide repeat protein [Oceanospirillaceae bacterium]
MTELRTEEEQLAAIKSWWKDNGKSLVIMIAVAVAAVYGFKAWQKQQITANQNASAMYQRMITLAVPAADADAEENLATSKHIAKSLKEEYQNSEYAKFASLLMAKIAVNSGDLNAAEQELDWVLNSEPKPLVKAITLIRKAQIDAEQGEYDSALKLLSGVTLEALNVQAGELEGDIYVAKGDTVKARAAYQKALDSKEVGSAQQILSMKINDLTAEEG